MTHGLCWKLSGTLAECECRTWYCKVPIDIRKTQANNYIRDKFIDHLLERLRQLEPLAQPLDY